MNKDKFELLLLNNNFKKIESSEYKQIEGSEYKQINSLYNIVCCSKYIFIKVAKFKVDTGFILKPDEITDKWTTIYEDPMLEKLIKNYFPNFDFRLNEEKKHSNMLSQLYNKFINNIYGDKIK